MDAKKKKMLEKLRKNRISKSRERLRKSLNKQSRSVSPRPKNIVIESPSKNTVKMNRSKRPVSRFNEDPKQTSFEKSPFEVESPFNERKGPPSNKKSRQENIGESKVSKKSNFDPVQSRETNDEKRNRFQRKYLSTNEFKSIKRDKSGRSIKSNRGRGLSQSRSPSTRKLNLPKYLTRKNSKFNKTAGSIKIITNYPKIKYILTHVLLVGKWNEARRKKYLEFAKKFQNNHLVVIFKNKNGHDCLGK